jgi:hypothetical protein
MDSIRLSALQETRDEMAHARRAHQADKADTCDRYGQQSKKGSSKKKQKKKQQKRQRSKARSKAEAQQQPSADGTLTGGSSAKQDGETAQSLEHKVGQPTEDAFEKAEAGAAIEQHKQGEEEEPEVEACPICEWEGDDDDDEDEEEGMARVALACGHSVFHRLCLQAWSRKCREKGLDFTCPMCRAIITTDI